MVIDYRKEANFARLVALFADKQAVVYCISRDFSRAM
jgi:hypothetical protein